MKQDEFLKEVTNWNNFLPLLWLGLEQSIGPVTEYGSGGSTALLKKYCKDAKRKFYSYDYNADWAKKTGAQYVANWDELELKECGLAFVDHSPGEHRHIMLKRLVPLADIICVHDTEIGGAGNYMFHKALPLFKYQLHYNRYGGGAGASLVSNKVDVSQYKGSTVGGLKLDD